MRCADGSGGRFVDCRYQRVCSHFGISAVQGAQSISICRRAEKSGIVRQKEVYKRPKLPVAVSASPQQRPSSQAKAKQSSASPTATTTRKKQKHVCTSSYSCTVQKNRQEGRQTARQKTAKIPQAIKTSSPSQRATNRRRAQQKHQQINLRQKVHHTHAPPASGLAPPEHPHANRLHCSALTSVAPPSLQRAVDAATGDF